MRAEYQRGCRPVRSQSMQKAPRGGGGVFGVGHTRFFGQRDVIEPIEQSTPHRSDNSELRKMSMRVYQPWNQDAVAAVDCLDVRMSAVDVVVTAARDNPASIDKKGAIVVRDERSGIPGL